MSGNSTADDPSQGVAWLKNAITHFALGAFLKSGSGQTPSANPQITTLAQLTAGSQVHTIAKADNTTKIVTVNSESRLYVAKIG